MIDWMRKLIIFRVCSLSKIFINFLNIERNNNKRLLHHQISNENWTMSGPWTGNDWETFFLFRSNCCCGWYNFFFAMPSSPEKHTAIRIDTELFRTKHSLYIKPQKKIFQSDGTLCSRESIYVYMCNAVQFV